jgi:hypothetical protein
MRFSFGEGAIISSPLFSVFPSNAEQLEASVGEAYTCSHRLVKRIWVIMNQGANSMHNRYRRIGLLFSAAVIIAASRLLFAAQMLPGTMTQAEERSLMLVPQRSVDEIQRDIDSADQARMAATEAERTAQEQRSSATAMIAEKKRAISANKDKLKIAKREKNESEKLVLTTEGKTLRRDLELLEQREALRGAEIELARKRNELAALTKQALDLERQLVLKRTEPTETSASGTDSVRIARVLIDLEKATLEAQKKAADKQSEVADGARSVVGRQLKTLHARQNIYSGK